MYNFLRIAADDGSNRRRAVRNKSSNDEFLRSIDPHLNLGASSFPLLVETILAFSYDAFEFLFADGCKHIVGGNVELLRDANTWRAQLD
jgi:hypothetical protein